MASTRDAIGAQLDEAKARITQLTRDVGDLKADNDLMSIKVDNLNKLVNHWKKHKEMLSTELDRQRKENDVLQSRITVLERQEAATMVTVRGAYPEHEKSIQTGFGIYRHLLENGLHRSRSSTGPPNLYHLRGILEGPWLREQWVDFPRHQNSRGKFH
jgi:hypothetical protein